MRKAAAIAAVTALLLKGATAANLGDPAPGASPAVDADKTTWHGGGHRGGGGRGRGGGDGGNGDGGTVIVGFPSPSGPDAPYPYPPNPYPYPGLPAPGPSGRPPAVSNSTSSQPRPWPVWYYCDQPSGYYPYVKICTHDWQRLPSCRLRLVLVRPSPTVFGNIATTLKDTFPTSHNVGIPGWLPQPPVLCRVMTPTEFLSLDNGFIVRTPRITCRTWEAAHTSGARSQQSRRQMFSPQQNPRRQLTSVSHFTPQRTDD